MTTYHVPFAVATGHCSACGLGQRPTWKVGRRALCASCVTRALALVPGDAVVFGTASDSKKRNGRAAVSTRDAA